MKKSVICTISILLVLEAGQGMAQTRIIRREGPQALTNLEGEPFLLNELGAILAATGGTIKVVSVMPPGQRPAAYKDVDLQQDDIVPMANGRRVTSTKDLQSIYDTLAIGSPFKLGVKRGEEMLLVSFTKGDPKSLPHIQTRIVQAGGGGNVEEFPLVGVVVTMKGRTLVIDKLLPGETPVKKLDVMRGDIISSINGTEVATLKEYDDVFDKVAPGTDVTWVLTRGEKKHTITFPRPRPRLLIRREGAGK